jgi:immune inhibitor A
VGIVLIAAVSIGSYAVFQPFTSHASPKPNPLDAAAKGSHDLPSPLGIHQRALTQQALKLKAQGKVSGKVVRIGHGRRGYVQLERDRESPVWGIIGEFSDQTFTTPGGTNLGGDPGPLHNQIPQPDRNKDNTTIWQADFNQQHYNDILFGGGPNDISMRNYYLEQSSNRYTVHGNVEDWVQVPYNEARYGTDLCGSIVCSTVYNFVQDEATAWYNAKSATMTDAQINAYLAQFDQEDRYDYDGDGIFDEPDGYIDHFESIHAGEGEETGGGVQGENAIWSHRSYAFFSQGVTGPAFNKLGGVHIGNTNFWIGDYQMQPENGGVGVFSHEFGHDLGLPDEYDTFGNTSAVENSTGWWTIMSQGSYGTGNNTDLGTKPVSMSSWDKYQLGWLNYDVADSSSNSNHILGPAEYNTVNAQAVLVNLPDKVVTTHVGTPYAGSKFYYSGTADQMDTAMTKAFTVSTGATLSAKVRYNIEQDFDYAYLEASTDGGANWTHVTTNLSTTSDPFGQNLGQGITGVSAGGDWVDLIATLPAFSGSMQLRFEYVTDPAQQGTPGAEQYTPGFSVDEINVTGSATDGAETNPTGWAFTSDTTGVGFHATTGTETNSYFNAYIAEYRQYRGYDDSLRTGPYNFGFLNNPNKQNYVEHFRYADGLLVWYWDTSEGDNNTSVHPGSGLILPVDSHPTPLIRPDGQPWRPRVQSYDATFDLEKTDELTLRLNSVKRTYPSQPGVSVFNDNNSYWNAQIPTSSVQVPHTGTKIRIQGFTDLGLNMRIRVGPSA